MMIRFKCRLNAVFQAKWSEKITLNCHISQVLGAWINKKNIFENGDYSHSTRKNAIVDYLDYQIPVTQLKGPKGNGDSSKARLKCAIYRR